MPRADNWSQELGHLNYKALMITALALTTCSQQPQADLNTALKGIDKSRFLSCSGPPSLEIPQGAQDRMWFVTNLKRGQSIGVLGPTADPVESCSVAAEFENSRLTNATFSGNQSMCQMVFGPCVQK
jgi:hypothetical protein